MASIRLTKQLLLSSDDGSGLPLKKLLLVGEVFEVSDEAALRMAGAGECELLDDVDEDFDLGDEADTENQGQELNKVPLLQDGHDGDLAEDGQATNAAQPTPGASARSKEPKPPKAPRASRKAARRG